MRTHLTARSPAAKVNPILVEEVTLNPEAAAKKHKAASDKTASKRPGAPATAKRPAKKAGAKSGKKINSSEKPSDDAGAAHGLPARVTRLTPQVFPVQLALNCLTCFSQHLDAGMQVLAVVKEVQDLEIRVRFDASLLYLFAADAFVSLSLADGLTAIVSATDVSTELTELLQRAAKEDTALPSLKVRIHLSSIHQDEDSRGWQDYFTVGQAVRGVMKEVTKSDKGTRTHLSLYPSKINAGISPETLTEGMVRTNR